MGTPFFILATGQSNIIGRNVMSWSPNPRAKYWNNQIQNDTDTGTAYGAIDGGLMGIAPRYAHNIANADINKDVYFAEYSRGGMGIDHWVGGAFFSLQYSSAGPGKIYVNSSNPATISAMQVDSVDLLGVARRGTGSALNVGEFVWLKQGAAYGKYRIDSAGDNPTGSPAPTSVSVYCTCVASSGAFTEGTSTQVEFQPRFLTMIENSVPVALAAAGTSTVDIVLWWQGETDSRPSVNANYATEFNFFMSYMAGKSWWGPNTKLIICGINSTANNTYPTSDQMNGVLSSLVSGHSERYFCNTAANLAPNRWQDVWHLTAQGYAEAGDLLINNVYAPPPASGGTPTYSVSASTSSVVEGSSVTFNVTTTNVGSTTLYWTNAGTTTGADFSDGMNSGSISVVSNSGYFSRTLLSDGIADSGETVVIQLRTGSIYGTVVATASTVSVTDSGGGGGTGSITSVVAGAAAMVMDVTSASEHQLIDGNRTGYGLWIDGPPHPYKDGSGNMYLIIKHSENYRFRIPNLSNGASWVLQGPTMLSARDASEGHYNNRQWAYGFWVNGSTIHALTHHEWYRTMYTSAGIPGFNALNYTGVGNDFNKEWVNAIGHATSSDGGATFTINPTNSSSRCVLIPEPWSIQSARHMFGFFHASNIVKEGSYYYSAVEQRSIVNPAAGNAVCGMSLIRTTDTSTPLGWEFWNGASWVTVNHSTYQGNLSSQVPYRFFEQTNNFYTTAANSNIGQNIRYHTPSGQWLIFGFVGGYGEQFGYSTSVTLANPQFTTITPISSPNPSIFYPYSAVFDETATDQNYQNIGNNLTILSVDSSVVKIYKSAMTITVSGGSPTPTYSVSPSGSTVAEGSSVTFNVTTTNVGSTTLYWTNAGTTTGADFSDVQNSGSFGVSFDSGSIVRTLSNDGVTDPGETIVIQIRTGSTSGPIVATATAVTVTEAGATPTYSVTPSTTNINEGQGVTFTITTTNVGTTNLYWTNSGSTTSVDFSDGVNAGTFTVTSDLATISRTTINDLTTEGSETIVLQIRTGSTSGPVVATSATVVVNDTSVPTGPTYSIIPSISSLNEGQIVTFNVTTTNVGSATLYWTNSGSTSGADFVGGQNSGSISVVSNSGSLSRTIVEDLATEGSETIVIQLRTGSTSGPIVAIASTVTVVDSSVNPPSYTAKLWVRNPTNTAWLDAAAVAGFKIRNASNTGWIDKTTTLAGVGVRNALNNDWIFFGGGGSPAPTYSLTPTATIMNEGESVSFNVTTTNFGTGMLYWTTAGSVGAGDFTDSVTSGSVAVTGNAGTIIRTLTNDVLTEGSETFYLSLRTGSTGGPVVASSATVTVTDTSVPSAATYAVTPSVTALNESESVTFSVTTTNVGSATLYWTNAGSSVGTDFSDGQNSGSISVVSNSGSLVRTTINDLATEGSETIVLQIRTGSTSGPVVATAPTVTIIDSSVPSMPTELTMDRNNLDFFFFPTYISSYEGTFDVRVTFTTDNFFNHAVNATDHIVFAIDDAGVQGSSNPHCGPIIRNGVNLFSTARGFLILRNNGVFSEVWNGTASPVVAAVANTSGQVFNPLTGTYTLRLRAGYSTGTGFYENRMFIQISAGTSMYDPVVFAASVPLTRPYTGTHRLMIGAISDGFVGANPGNGCTEPSAPGTAYGGYVPFSNYSQGYY